MGREVILSTSEFRFERTVARLVEAVPEFVPDLEEEDYYNLGLFGRYLRDGIVSGELPADVLTRAFKILNELGESDSDIVQTQLIVGILEILTDTPESIAAAKANLTGGALRGFNEALAFWRQ